MILGLFVMLVKMWHVKHLDVYVAARVGYFGPGENFAALRRIHQ